jgi:hypothetical protein
MALSVPAILRPAACGPAPRRAGPSAAPAGPAAGADGRRPAPCRRWRRCGPARSRGDQARSGSAAASQRQAPAPADAGAATPAAQTVTSLGRSSPPAGTMVPAVTSQAAVPGRTSTPRASIWRSAQAQRQVERREQARGLPGEPDLDAGRVDVRGRRRPGATSRSPATVPARPAPSAAPPATVMAASLPGPAMLSRSRQARMRSRSATASRRVQSPQACSAAPVTPK